MATDGSKYKKADNRTGTKSGIAPHPKARSSKFDSAFGYGKEAKTNIKIGGKKK